MTKFLTLNNLTGKERGGSGGKSDKLSDFGNEWNIKLRMKEIVDTYCNLAGEVVSDKATS